MDKELQVYTVQEVAEILQLNEETIRRKLRSGELVGTNFGRTWRVTHENLTKFIKGE